MNKEYKDIIDRVRNKFNENITEDLLKNIIEFSKKKVFKKGELILRMGEPMSKVYFITKGIARSYYIDMQGNDLTKNFIYKMNRENGFQIKSETERYLEFKRSYYEI